MESPRNCLVNGCLLVNQGTGDVTPPGESEMLSAERYHPWWPSHIGLSHQHEAFLPDLFKTPLSLGKHSPVLICGCDMTFSCYWVPVKHYIRKNSHTHAHTHKHMQACTFKKNFNEKVFIDKETSCQESVLQNTIMQLPENSRGLVQILLTVSQLL